MESRTLGRTYLLVSPSATGLISLSFSVRALYSVNNTPYILALSTRKFPVTVPCSQHAAPSAPTYGRAPLKPFLDMICRTRSAAPAQICSSTILQYPPFIAQNLFGQMIQAQTTQSMCSIPSKRVLPPQTSPVVH